MALFDYLILRYLEVPSVLSGKHVFVRSVTKSANVIASPHCGAKLSFYNTFVCVVSFELQ
jgi:hypothetical protein